MKKINFALMLLMFAIILPLTGCKNDESSVALPITDEPDDDEDDDTPIEDTLAETFYVVAYRGSTKTAYTSHTLVGTPTVDSSWATPCSVPASDIGTGAADVVCMIEAHELDLYYSGVNIKVSVPANLCDYVREEPYHYFAYEPGRGPTGPYAWAAADPETTSCSYNYTLVNGPNCCTGSWTMNAGADPVTQPARTGDWSGNFSNCLAGPNLASFPKDILARPMDLVYQDDGEGVAFSRTWAAPIVSTPYPFSSNVSVANYFNPDNHLGATNYTPIDDLYGGATAPAAFNFKNDVVGGNWFYTNPFHTFNCLDTNHELKARIRVVVREWNTKAAMAQGGDPDSSGGTTVDPENDFLDWADFDATFPESAQ